MLNRLSTRTNFLVKYIHTWYLIISMGVQASFNISRTPTQERRKDSKRTILGCWNWCSKLQRFRKTTALWEHLALTEVNTDQRLNLLCSDEQIISRGLKCSVLSLFVPFSLALFPTSRCQLTRELRLPLGVTSKTRSLPSVYKYARDWRLRQTSLISTLWGWYCRRDVQNLAGRKNGTV